MGQDKESFRDKLTKMAESVEILENSFINNTIEVKIKIQSQEFEEITTYLNADTSQNECIVSIGKTNFIFLKM